MYPKCPERIQAHPMGKMPVAILASMNSTTVIGKNYPSHWPTYRHMRLAMAGWRCQNVCCPEKHSLRNLEVHHIRYGPNQSLCVPWNWTMVLCRVCHRQLELNREVRAGRPYSAKAQSIRAEIDGDRQPWLIFCPSQSALGSVNQPAA